MLALWLLVAFVVGVTVGRAVWGGRVVARDGAGEALRSELRRREALDEARIRFFGNIAHELLTPLTLVLAHLETAQVEGDPARQGRALRVASRNARRIERLARQALQLTRLDAGTLRANLRERDVVPYLESLVLSFEELADRKGLSIEFFARPRSIVVRVDTDHLTTIVSNLVSNALRYTPPGGRVGVAVESRPADERGHLRLVVTDTGPGLPEEIRETIFDRFARGADADRTHPAGAGIGLALVRELARLHGGDVALESEPGRGARFVVTLPHAGPVAETSAPPLGDLDARPEITEEILYRTTAEEGEAESRTERPVLLVADDNADLRAWLADELGDLGEVETARDGGEALAAARESVPDAIVADVRMPSHDGLDLCRRLRADERTSHIPILLLSVRSEVDDRVRAIEAGADDFLSKPVDPRELRARVARLMESRDALRERHRARVSVRTSEVEAPSVDQEFIDRVVEVIEEEIGNGDFSVPELADAVALSTSQLTRKLRSLLGQTPGQLIRSLRLRRGAELLAAKAGSVGRIAYSVGFSDQAHFTRSFKREFGMTPTDYRRREAPSPVEPAGPRSAEATDSA